MKKLELNQMENLNGGSCQSTLTSGARPSFTSQEACIICSGVTGLVGGLAGWGVGLIAGFINC